MRPGSRIVPSNLTLGPARSLLVRAYPLVLFTSPPPLMRRFLIAPLLLLVVPTLAWGQSPAIDRIDPPFWWVGMERPTVELMVYGPNIAETRVAVADHPGVRLQRVTAVENSNYAFVRLHIADTAAPGSLTLRFRHDDGTITRDYRLRERQNAGPSAQGFSSEDVIYLLMPDRFANGNPENDEINGFLEGVDRSDPNARHGGDFAGVREHLDYIDDLGMTAIWMTRSSKTTCLPSTVPTTATRPPTCTGSTPALGATTRFGTLWRRPTTAA